MKLLKHIKEFFSKPDPFKANWRDIINLTIDNGGYQVPPFSAENIILAAEERAREGVPAIRIAQMVDNHLKKYPRNYPGPLMKIGEKI